MEDYNSTTSALFLYSFFGYSIAGKYNGGNSRPRRSGYPYQYQQQPVEITSFAPENLAQRLGVTQQSLITERETKTEKEFISWSRNRDPMSLGWKFQVSVHYRGKLGSQPCYRQDSYCGGELVDYRHGV